MNDFNSYIDFNKWISGIIANGKEGKALNVNKIIKITSRLPTPDTEEKYKFLVNSGINYCLDEFASCLGLFSKIDSSVVKKKAKTKDNELIVALDLNEFWKIWEKLFLKSGWDYYISHLIESSNFQKRKAALDYAYHKITHQGDKCFNSSCDLTEDLEESNKFQIKHLTEYIALSRESILGCEGFVHGSIATKNSELFERIYKYWNSKNTSKLKLSWVPFIIGAGVLKRTDILKDIWRSMKFECQEICFYHRACLLESADKAKVDEIVQYFNDLNSPSYWDLSKSHDSYLDLLLSKLSTESSANISNALVYRSFEGKFWKLFFSHHLEGQPLKVESIFYETGYYRFLQKKDLTDWNLTLCLAQETYARELRSRLYIELQNQFSYLNSIEENSLFKKIVNGNLSAQIKNYQDMVTQILSKSIQIPMTDEILEYKFVPFIDFFLSNHMSFVKNRENFYKWQNDGGFKSSFFKKAEKYLKVIKMQEVPEQDWLYFLYLLLSQIRKNIDNFYSEMFLSEIHSMKRLFVKNFEIPLQGIDATSTERYELVQNAKRFLLDISRRLPSYRIMAPKKINITPEINKHLLKDYYEIKESILPCDYTFYVAGYDGIFEDYLAPILIETRSNAEKALSQIPREERHYQVNLKYGKNGFSGYGILSVTNNFAKNDKNKSFDPISTGIGLKNIQYYATFFQHDSKQGWAQFKTESRKKYNFFITNIFFPLWEESFEEAINHA